MAETTYPAPLPWHPRIASLRSARTTYARPLREYAAGKLSREDARTWAHLMSVFLQILKLENEQEQAERLRALEERIGELEGEKNATKSP